jgi:hypothetical protein
LGNELVDRLFAAIFKRFLPSLHLTINTMHLIRDTAQYAGL